MRAFTSYICGHCSLALKLGFVTQADLCPFAENRSSHAAISCNPSL